MKLNIYRKLQDPIFLLQKAAWLISKGADMYRKSPVTNIPAIFFLSHAVGRHISTKSCWDASVTDLLQKILIDDACDGCLCPCSVNGCSALAKLLDGVFDRTFRSSLNPRKNKRENCYIRLWKLLEPFDSSRRDGLCFDSIVAPAIIRYVTFTELEITHTCHKIENSRGYAMHQQDVYEIQDEEADIIQDLEDLVEEFSQGYVDHPYSLREYIMKVMWPRLDGSPSGSQWKEASGNEANGLDELALKVNLARIPGASRWRPDHQE
ncbi:hypothetical protein BJX65DRAFT_304004 [Aspergillus insuetus]